MKGRCLHWGIALSCGCEAIALELLALGLTGRRTEM